MHLRIMCNDNDTYSMYEDHSIHHEGDSGLDIFFPDEINLSPKETKIINLKIKCEAWKNANNPESYSYFIFPRSSISKTPLRMSNSVGIIDAGYRGNLKVAVDNTSDEAYVIEKGISLFQICSPILGVLTYEFVNTLSDSSRGEGGFGSTNK